MPAGDTVTPHGYPDPVADDDLIDAAEAAELIGVKHYTFTSYVSRGRAPAPVRRIAGRNVYSRTEVLEWHASRPGPGARTDLATK